jgi:hypothetical protein
VFVDSSERDGEEPLQVVAQLELSTGITCTAAGKLSESGLRGVDVWTDQGYMCRWDWAPPAFFKDGVPVQVNFPDTEFPQFGYLADSIRSMLRCVEHGPAQEPLYVSGRDVLASLEVSHGRHCRDLHSNLAVIAVIFCQNDRVAPGVLEVATAVNQSATAGSVPVTLAMGRRVIQTPLNFLWSITNEIYSAASE